MRIKAFPSLVVNHEPYLTTLELIDLAQNNDLEISLASPDGSIKSGFFLSAKSSSNRHMHKGFDGLIYRVSPADMMRSYPLSLGRVWRIDRKTPAKSLYRFITGIWHSIVKSFIWLMHFSPLVYFW